MSGTPRALVRYLQKARFKSPFRPMTIVLRSGERYRVRDREKITVSSSWIIVRAPREPIGFAFFCPDEISSIEGGGDGSGR